MSLLSQTTQAAVLSATSNILAQVIQAYQEDKPFSINPRPLLKFVLFTLLNTPPNVLWQAFLEEKFPGQKQPKLKEEADPSEANEKKKKKIVQQGGGMDVANVVKKFLLDQTAGALVNTVMFVAFMAGAEGRSGAQVVEAIKRESWPLMLTAAKVWPLVSIISFVFVPVEKRVVFGGAIGVLWGIYLSLLQAER